MASADSIFEVCDRKDFNIAQISDPSSSVDRFSELENRLVNLIDKKFSQLNVQSRPRSRSRSKNRNKNSPQ